MVGCPLRCGADRPGKCRPNCQQIWWTMAAAVEVVAAFHQRHCTRCTPAALLPHARPPRLRAWGLMKTILVSLQCGVADIRLERCYVMRSRCSSPRRRSSAGPDDDASGGARQPRSRASPFSRAFLTARPPAAGIDSCRRTNRSRGAAFAMLSNMARVARSSIRHRQASPSARGRKPSNASEDCLTAQCMDAGFTGRRSSAR